jgi:hypothetical protein
MRRLLLTAALAGLAGCAPSYLTEVRPGDRVVTTYARVFGLEATKLNNREAALDACRPDNFVLFDEQIGQDDNGVYRRWRFGCVAP